VWCFIHAKTFNVFKNNKRLASDGFVHRYAINSYTRYTLEGAMNKSVDMLETISRRELIKRAGTLLMLGPVISLTSCQGVDQETSSSSGSGSTTVDATTDWASGGTGLITVDYPDDSLFESATVCALSLTQATTEGPCYLGVSELEDISEDRNGLPMMLCLQLVDQSCNPLEGYLIEVWHCDRSGVYSGDTSSSDDTTTFAGSFCTGGNSEAEASTWFRGEMTTDSSGRINLKSCFPGWYAGRTIHIHFRVRLPYGGSDYVVSQFCFSDAFAEEICTGHSLYSSRGVQDTTLASGSDTVFPDSGYDEYMLNLEQNSDGTLLAYKRIMIEV
jgi:protocatechuate 3,4-dioxygenase beta subunit